MLILVLETILMVPLQQGCFDGTLATLSIFDHKESTSLVHPGLSYHTISYMHKTPYFSTQLRRDAHRSEELFAAVMARLTRQAQPPAGKTRPFCLADGQYWARLKSHMKL